MAEKIKMLVADDSYPSRAILSEEFKNDYEVILAEDGAECIDILNAVPDIAVIILDLIMPEVDGFTVLRKIISDERFNKIPVFAITSSDSDDDLVDALDLGAFDVMKKPLNLSVASHKIRNMLARTAVYRQDKTTEIIKHMAENSEIDEKTGIYNKRTFCRKVREMMDVNPSRRYVMLRWDIDSFKVLNDVYGVSEGDRLLKLLGDNLAKRCEVGMLYGHWEADHFVMCMDLEDFNRYHVTDYIIEPFEGNFDFGVSIRMGVYVVEDTSLDVSLMCDRALMALKSIKNNFTKHIAFYDDTMRIELIEKQQVVNEMKTALESGQFVVYLQPQFNYASMTLHGAEALVRWKHPDKGIVPPLKFIPVFEENGFITHLDQYVWEEVCKLQRSWLDQGRKIVPISVNVSRTDICSLRLAEFFSRLVDKYDLPTWAIRIEITESAYMDNPAQLINSVDKLREAGFSVEMDDFGSGYSSLNTLKDVPVDMLKLDMKFIEDDGKESRGGSILSSVVRMSNWLRLPVLAEGVENRNQAEYLKSIGCIYMQGYYFAKPMPVEEYEKLMHGSNHEQIHIDAYKDDISDAMEFLNASTQATLLFNSFVGGAAIIEFDGRNVDAVRINDKFFEIVESTREEYLSQNTHLLDRFDRINTEKFKKALQRAIDTGEEASCELCSTDMKPGQEIWTRARVRLLATNVDKHLFYLTIENISQRMNLLVSNLRLTDQLTTIINNVPGGIADYELNDSGVYKMIYFNDKLPMLFGYTREEFDKEIASSPLIGVYPDDIEKVVHAVQELYDGVLSSVSIRYRHLCKDGSWKWVEFNGGRTRRQGNLVYITSTITDRDETIRAEQIAITKERESARQQKLMTAVYGSIPYGVIQLTYNLGRYDLAMMNDAVWHILKFDSEDDFKTFFLQNGSRLDVVGEDNAIMDSAVHEVMAGPDGSRREFRVAMRCKDGEIIDVMNYVQKVVFNNEIEYVQHIFVPAQSA